MLEDLPRPKDFPFFISRILSVRIALALAVGAIFVQLVRQCIVRGDEFYHISRTNFLKTQSLDAPFGRPGGHLSLALRQWREGEAGMGGSRHP